MLIGNYSVFNKTPGRWLAGNSTAGQAYAKSLSNFNASGPFRNFALQDGATSVLFLIARPTGYANGWMLPIKGGAISSHFQASGSTLLEITMAAGRNIAGSVYGATLAEALGQLVVSAVGTAAGATTMEGSIRAALAAIGTASGSTAGSGVIGALAWANGESAGSTVATLTSYAVGRLYGSITPFTELSPENLAAAVWDSLLSNHQQSGSMGEAITAAGGGMTPASIWQYLVDGSFSAEELMRLMASALLGKASGANSSEMRFRDLADTKDRIVATVDQYGNRAAVTLDAD